MPKKGWRKYGGDLARLMSKLVPNERGCLVYQGAVRKDTLYGAITITDPETGKWKSKDAHLLMWELVKGPVPKGLHLDHTCKNKLCCNVEHLEPVTPRVNGYVRNEKHAGKVLAERTHCKHGHEFTPENIYRSSGKAGRICKICTLATQRSKYERQHPGAHKLKGTHCKRGHEYTPENSVVHKSTGAKQCRTCRDEAQKRYRERTGK